MAKAGELDWSDLLNKSEEYKHTPSALWVNDPSIGVTPKGDAKPLLAKGEVPVAPSNEAITAEIMRGMDKPGLRQPTDEELFGHLVVPQEQIDAAEKSFETKIADFYSTASKPINGGQTEVPDEEWANGKSFNSMLPKEELAKRNMYLGDD
jgi:hypothetical protein